MKSANEIAMQIWENWRGQSKSDCIDEIAQALLEARNEGFEEAAKVATGVFNEDGNKRMAFNMSVVKAIRQLKEPSDG